MKCLTWGHLWLGISVNYKLSIQSKKPAEMLVFYVMQHHSHNTLKHKRLECLYADIVHMD